MPRFETEVFEFSTRTDASKFESQIRIWVRNPQFSSRFDSTAKPYFQLTMHWISPLIFPSTLFTNCFALRLSSIPIKSQILDVSMIFPKRGMNSAVKSAIYTMVAIVFTYLLSNSLHLVLTALERSQSVLLRHPTDPNLASTFHTVFSDIVSFVYMFTSAIRVIIYYICNSAIRADLKQTIKSFFAHRSKNINDSVAIWFDLFSYFC